MVSGTLYHFGRSECGMGDVILVPNVYGLGASLAATADGHLSEPEPALGFLSIHVRYDDSLWRDAVCDHQADRAAPICHPQCLPGHDECRSTGLRQGGSRLRIIRFLSGVSSV